MAWTDDTIATLKRMWSECEPAAAISDALGGRFSRNAVIAKAHRLGLDARLNPTDWDAQFERAADLVIEPPYLSIKEAARQAGLSETIMRRLWVQKIESTHGGDPA